MRNTATCKTWYCPNPKCSCFMDNPAEWAENSGRCIMCYTPFVWVPSGTYCHVSSKGDYIDWLVELTAKDFPDMILEEIVEANNEHEAMQRALETRNVPDNWHVSNIISEEG